MRGAPSGDYHEYFEINDVPDKAEVKALIGVESPLKVLMSKLNFNGHAGGDFLTLPSVCSNTTTSYLELESWPNEQGQTEIADAVTHTPVGVEGCDRVPFAPTSEVGPELAASGSDQPDGATTVVDVKQNTGAEEINTADIQNAHVTLPIRLDAQSLGGAGPGSVLGRALRNRRDNADQLPGWIENRNCLDRNGSSTGSLTGNVYLASPSGAMIENPPYTIYLEVNATGVIRKPAWRACPCACRARSTPTPSPAGWKYPSKTTPSCPSANCVSRSMVVNVRRSPIRSPAETAPTESLFTAYSGEGVFRIVCLCHTV